MDSLLTKSRCKNINFTKQNETQNKLNYLQHTVINGNRNFQYSQKTDADKLKYTKNLNYPLQHKMAALEKCSRIQY